jgi:hypothetical protein
LNSSCFRFFPAVASGLVEFSSAIYTLMSFYAWTECEKQQEGSTALYYLLLIGFSILSLPSTFCEQMLKSLEYLRYYSEGVTDRVYKYSYNRPWWFNKIFSGIMQMALTIPTGFNIATYFTSSYPVDQSPGYLNCTTPPFDSTTAEKIGMGLGGGAATFALGGPQMMAFFGDFLPLLGENLTAANYAFYKMCAAFYPALKSITDNIEEQPLFFSFQMLFLLVIFACRFQVYKRSNQRVVIKSTIKESSTPAQKEMDVNDLLDKKIKGNIAHSPYKNVIKILSSIIGSSALAYFTVLSFESMNKSMGFEEYNERLKYFYIPVSVLFGIERYFRFMASYFGYKGLEESK